MLPVIKHFGILCLGIFGMICMLKVKCKYFKVVTPIVLFFSFCLLILVLVTGQSTNGASRWLTFFGLQFQPSEIAKGAVVLAVAQILSAMQTDNGTGADKRALKFVAFTSAPFILLIGLENLSTAMLLCITILFMMIIGRVPNIQIGRIIGIVALLGGLAFTVIEVAGTDKQAKNPDNTLTETVTEEEEDGTVSKIFHRADTWKSRINKFLFPNYNTPEDVDLDKDAQVAHANIAIASSNVVGKGPGNSTERDYLSQAFSDFIFAIIVEEMGIVGAIFVAFLYIMLLFRTSSVASRCENNFPAFLAMGLTILLVTQALFNMCVAVGLAPVTGQPLPLVSRGGTSTIINCLYVGIILSISRTAKKRESYKGDRMEDKLVMA